MARDTSKNVALILAHIGVLAFAYFVRGWPLALSTLVVMAGKMLMDASENPMRTTWVLSSHRRLENNLVFWLGFLMSLGGFAVLLNFAA